MNQKIEFGDWQTPQDFAILVANKVKNMFPAPEIIIEPTCGIGAFISASQKVFPDTKKIIGFDISGLYIEQAKSGLTNIESMSVTLNQGDFFNINWCDIITQFGTKSILLIGNPPWVTNSALGLLDSSNLPTKSNFSNEKGLDALMGKSNFDISEWMLIHLLEAAQGANATFSFLCKTTVARKVIKFAKQRSFLFSNAHLFHIDAMQIFSAAVDACLFVFQTNNSKQYVCSEYEHMHSASSRNFGFVGDDFVADINAYNCGCLVEGQSPVRWRSGVKHDCAKVLELTVRNGELFNGFNDRVDVEHNCLFPLLKSSDLHNQRPPSKWIIITQLFVGDDTSKIETTYPKLWDYLSKFEHLFSSRKSSIYKGKPQYSIFGVGDYTFMPWKVAISGLYKNTSFRLIAPYEGKPVLFDDTCYFLYFTNEIDAKRAFLALSSESVKSFLTAISFKDSKRPVTVELLRRIDYNKANIATSIIDHQLKALQ